MIGILLGSVVLAGNFSVDVRVDGQGLMRFARDGRAVYAKEAHLTVTDGILGKAGVSLLPEIRVPASTESISIDLEGNVTGIAHESKVALGKLVLAIFPLEDGLVPDGPFLVAKDRPKLCEAGDDTAGVFRMAGDTAKQPAKVADKVVADATPTKHVVAPYHSPTKAPAVAGKAQIDINTESQVAGDKILLGEIATIAGDGKVCEQLKALEVGDSPAFGVTRGLDRSSIESRLIQAGYKADAITLNMPTSAKLQRKSQTISGDQILQAAIAAATQKAPGVTYKNDQPALDFLAPLGEVTLTAENFAINRTATVVTVAVLVDGKRINSRNVTLKPDSSFGITAGQIVKITLRSAGAVIEVGGKARTGGLAGQTVTVVADTGAVLNATVTGPDRVEVKM